MAKLRTLWMHTVKGTNEQGEYEILVLMNAETVQIQKTKPVTPAIKATRSLYMSRAEWEEVVTTYNRENKK